MSSVGLYLREKRVQRGVSFEEIARSTRVTPRYLVALESDDFSQLPPPVFTRGFIRAYCQTLDEAPVEALALYAQRPGAPGPGSRPPSGSTGSRAATGREGRGHSAILVSFLLLVTLAAALFVVGIALRSGREPRERQAAAVIGSPASNRPPDSRPESVPGAESRGLETEPPAAPLAPAPLIGVVASPYRLVAKTTEPTWLRVRTEDGHLTEENIPAGQVREWVSNRPFVLTVGNAGGVSLELNGRPVPALGASGVVIRDFKLPRERS